MPILKYKNPTTQLWEPVICGALGDGSSSGEESVDSYSIEEIDTKINELKTSVDSYSKEEIDTKINELKTSVSEGKALIAAAVTDKGVSTAANATFATIANNINSISVLNMVSGTVSGGYNKISIPAIAGKQNFIVICNDNNCYSYVQASNYYTATYCAIWKINGGTINTFGVQPDPSTQQLKGWYGSNNTDIKLSSSGDLTITRTTLGTPYFFPATYKYFAW